MLIPVREEVSVQIEANAAWVVSTSRSNGSFPPAKSSVGTELRRSNEILKGMANSRDSLVEPRC